MFKELNIIRIFFEEPNREFNVREVARILKIAPATASSQLKELARERLLKEKKERNLIIYKANLDDERYKDLKVYYNIRKIKDSGLIEELNKFYVKPTIILFGSASFGLDTEDSDIDLVILSEKTKELSKKEEYEKVIKRRLQLFVIKNIKELKNDHLINNVLNGIVIQGELKWI
ncbi:nucleotidyltransferase domain-containing protein [Candidatus Pacearchaeota archaeon]|nr:nucleotidyltransferase domain-containing protein [Candidatus Pacearchaeota archaeon]